MPFSFFISSILIKIFLHLSRVDLTQLRLLCNLQISRANRWRSCKSRSMRGSWMMSRPTWPPLPGMKFAKLAIELYRLFVGYPLCTHRKYLLDICDYLFNYIHSFIIFFVIVGKLNLNSWALVSCRSFNSVSYNMIIVCYILVWTFITETGPCAPYMSLKILDPPIKVKRNNYLHCSTAVQGSTRWYVAHKRGK